MASDRSWRPYRVALAFLPLPEQREIRQASVFLPGAAMTRFPLILAFVSLVFAGAQAVPDHPANHPAMTDPYAWLEDIHGAKPLAWVKEQNRKSLAVLKADPRYQKNYDSILQ